MKKNELVKGKWYTINFEGNLQKAQFDIAYGFELDFILRDGRRAMFYFSDTITESDESPTQYELEKFWNGYYEAVYSFKKIEG